MIHVQCRSCYSTLALKDIYAGKLARCPICQNKVRVPKQEEEAEDEAREERVSAAPKARAPAESRRPSRRPVREEEEEEERPVRPKRRPIEEDDRSADIQEERPARPSRGPIEEEEDDDDVQLEVVEEPPARKRRKKKRRRRRRPESAGWEMPDVNWFYIGLAVVAFIWLVSVGLTFAFPLFMVIPILLGGLLMVAGRIWFLIIAFQDEIVHGILCLFLGIYNLYYLLINFEETKIPFFVELLGLLMVLSGFCAGGAFSHGK